MTDCGAALTGRLLGARCAGCCLEGWHLGEAGDMMSRILALCTGNGASQSMPLLMYMQDVQPGEYGGTEFSVVTLNNRALTLYSMASSTDMSALLFSAVSTAPPYTSRGTLRKICTRGGISTSWGCPDVVWLPYQTALRHALA